MDCPMNSTTGEKHKFTARLPLSPEFLDSASIDSESEVLKKPKLEEKVEVEVSMMKEETKLDEDIEKEKGTKLVEDEKETKLDEEDEEESDYYYAEMEYEDDDRSIHWSQDSDFYAEDENGYHEMNPKEQEEYYDRLFESDGFDVPYFPKAIAFGIIVPIGNLFANKAIYAELDSCAEYALKQHNAEAKKNYTFHKILKANMCGAAGVIYYITFQAEDLDRVGQAAEVVGKSGGPVVDFEAKVFIPIPDEQGVCEKEVMIFREKGSKVIEGSSGSSTKEHNCGD